MFFSVLSELPGIVLVHHAIWTPSYASYICCATSLSHTAVTGVRESSTYVNSKNKNNFWKNFSQATLVTLTAYSYGHKMHLIHVRTDAKILNS